MIDERVTQHDLAISCEPFYEWTRPNELEWRKKKEKPLFKHKNDSLVVNVLDFLTRTL